MSKLYAIYNGSGQRLFNIVAPGIENPITVVGIADPKIEEGDYDEAALRALPRTDYSGQKLSVYVNGGAKPICVMKNFRSTSKAEFMAAVSSVKVVFEKVETEAAAS